MGHPLLESTAEDQGRRDEPRGPLGHANHPVRVTSFGFGLAISRFVQLEHPILLIITHGDLTRCSVAESPFQCIANRFVTDWVECVTHPGDDDSVGIGHFGARDTEGKVKRNETIISSVDDGQRNRADHPLRHGARRLSRIPFWIDPHVSMTFSEEPTELGTGQNERNQCVDSKRNSPIGWTRDHDNPANSGSVAA